MKMIRGAVAVAVTVVAVATPKTFMYLHNDPV